MAAKKSKFFMFYLNNLLKKLQRIDSYNLYEKTLKESYFHAFFVNENGEHLSNIHVSDWNQKIGDFSFDFEIYNNKLILVLKKPYIGIDKITKNNYGVTLHPEYLFMDISNINFIGVRRAIIIPLESDENKKLVKVYKLKMKLKR